MRTEHSCVHRGREAGGGEEEGKTCPSQLTDRGLDKMNGFLHVFFTLSLALRSTYSSKGTKAKLLWCQHDAWGKVCLVCGGRSPAEEESRVNSRGCFPCLCMCVQSRPTLCNHTDRSLPGSSVHRILQARTWEFRLPFLSPGNFPNPGTEPVSPTLAGGFLHHWATWESHLFTNEGFRTNTEAWFHPMILVPAPIQGTQLTEPTPFTRLPASQTLFHWHPAIFPTRHQEPRLLLVTALAFLSSDQSLGHHYSICLAQGDRKSTVMGPGGSAEGTTGLSWGSRKAVAGTGPLRSNAPEESRGEKPKWGFPRPNPLQHTAAQLIFPMPPAARLRILPLHPLPYKHNPEFLGWHPKPCPPPALSPPTASPPAKSDSFLPSQTPSSPSPDCFAHAVSYTETTLPRSNLFV